MLQGDALHAMELALEKLNFQARRWQWAGDSGSLLACSLSRFRLVGSRRFGGTLACGVAAGAGALLARRQ